MCFSECLYELIYLILTNIYELSIIIIIIVLILWKGNRRRTLSTLKGHLANR